MMMKSAEDRPSGKLTVQLDRPIGWRILVQRQMRSEFVVVAGVWSKDPAQSDPAGPFLASSSASIVFFPTLNIE